MPSSAQNNDQHLVHTAEYIAALFLKKLQGQVSHEEQLILEQWLARQSDENREFLEATTDWTAIEAHIQKFYHLDTEAALQDVWTRIEQVPVKETRVINMNRWLKISSAAAIAALLIGSAWWFTHKHSINSTELPGTAHYANDVPPGSNKALLELADGSTIELDSNRNGKLAQQGNSTVVANGKGDISYLPAGAEDASTAVTYNRVTTPKGGTFKVVLPDNTIVWLNAASSIRYPTSFRGKNREVQITGEAYFDVAALAQQPFRVTVQRKDHAPITVDVLGTEFNIQAYPGETVHAATLVQGKVRVKLLENSSILQAGQQVIVDQQQEMQTRQADLSATLAWKNNLFNLQDASIQDIMNQVARWYNVEVTYEGSINQQFVGKIPRNMNLSSVLEILESTGWVRFRLEGRHLTVIARQ